jgi:UTP--glucose-1-phosphate uridylyltransferase
MGDDFIYNADGSSETSRMINCFKMSHTAALMTCIEKKEKDLHRYGVAKVENREGFNYLTALIEKPASGQAPSNLVNISKYVFTPQIFNIIEQQKPNARVKEVLITDSLLNLIKTDEVLVFTPQGTYLDGGNLSGWLKANLMVAKDKPELKQDLKAVIQANFC